MTMDTATLTGAHKGGSDFISASINIVTGSETGSNTSTDLGFNLPLPTLPIYVSLFAVAVVNRIRKKIK